MNESDTISTMEVLLELGFEPVAREKYPFPTVKFDFGNFTLYASESFNRWFEKIVSFDGVIVTPRTMKQVEFEVPRQLASREQCIAMLVYSLDRDAKGRVFEPTRRIDWLAEGRRNKHLLPWEIERAKRELEQAPFRARPKCSVQREWARLVVRTLQMYLSAINDETPVVFSFNDSVLTIDCNSKEYLPNLIAVAGTGADWPTKYAVRASKLRQLPKRFRSDYVIFSFWNGMLTIGDCDYAVITDEQP